MTQLTITLGVEDVQSALYFYGDLFPVKIKERQEKEGEILSARLTISDIPFELVHDPRGPLADNSGLTFTVEMDEDKLEELYDDALERDALPLLDPCLSGDGKLKTALFLDPFGFKWALVASVE
nr:VOC family protein [uncultured Peptoniphilus sp.]